MEAGELLIQLLIGVCAIVIGNTIWQFVSTHKIKIVKK